MTYFSIARFSPRLKRRALLRAQSIIVPTVVVNWAIFDCLNWCSLRQSRAQELAIHGIKNGIDGAIRQVAVDQRVESCPLTRSNVQRFCP
jgi:hypothetical protein